MPVGRYGEELQKANLYESYIKLLKEHFNPQTVPGLMCLDQLNIDWQGRVFDCDFNNQIELHPGGQELHIQDFNMDKWLKTPISVKEHCFTCTAGCGSSCSGSLADEAIE